MTNMSIQPLWLTHFIEILLVLELQLTKFIFGVFSYKAHFRLQISSNESNERLADTQVLHLVFHKVRSYPCDYNALMSNMVENT